jgi:MFS family permease
VLPFVQRSLDIPDERLGGFLAVIQLGGLVAPLLLGAADRLGRRRILIGCLTVIAACSLASAFASTAVQLMVAQCLLFGVLSAAETLFIVMVAEDVHSHNRGWASALVRTLILVGAALSMLTFAFVDWLPFGWRAVVGIGGLPLLAMPWLAAWVRETDRYQAERDRRIELASLGLRLSGPLLELWRARPGRLLALVVASTSTGVMAACWALLWKYLQDFHGYTPPQVALVAGGSSFFILAMNLVGGRLSDRFGRRRIIVAISLFSTAMALVVFNSSGAVMVLSLGLFVGAQITAVTLLRLYTSELFATSCRSTATAVRETSSVLFGVAALWAIDFLYPLAGGYVGALTWLLLLTLIAPIVIAVFLPETHGRPLEETGG